MSKYLSMRKGEVRDVEDSLAEKLIADGVAEQYNLIEPTGKITITENGSNIDVAQYAEADVAIPNPNSVVVVNATLGNPFDDGEGNSVDPAELHDLLTPTGADGEKKTQASAIIHFSFGGQTVDLPLVAGANIGAVGMQVTGSVNGVSIGWNYTTGALLSVIQVTSGVATDITTLAGSVPCVLTVVYHPLPEE